MMREEFIALFDAAAEALILLDPDHAESVAELIARLTEVRDLFGEAADSEHPACVALACALRIAEGDTSGIAELERTYAAARSLAEELPSGADADEAEPTAETEAVPEAKTAGSRTSSAKRPRKAAAPAAPEPSAPAPKPMPLAGDEELLRDFGIRATEHLDDADDQLLALESDPANAGAVDAVFRAFHTIKGMAGFLALDDISDHAHNSESLLADARANKTAVSEEAVRELFSAVDRMRELVHAATGIGGNAIATSAAKTGGAPAAAPSDGGAAPAVAAPVAASTREGTVRVEEARLDALLDTIGEMVIAESMVSSSLVTGVSREEIAVQVERLDKISRELQQMATSLRMVPLRATFRRMARLVSDLSHKAGKHIEFVTAGEDTELDKTVVDRISDPLIHALRNAVDHGIEGADERKAAGKPAVGRIELRAYHAGGSIHVEVSDDGRGIDPELVLTRARERGLVGAEERPADAELFDLLFTPGFSTAEVVTDVSGRGVGMDVVKRAVDELRGRIDLRSTPGEGSTLSVRLPITLAIIDGMVARVGSERYIIPMISIDRSVRPDASQISTVAGVGEMLALPDGLIPIVRLHRMFATPDAIEDPSEGVVVIASEGGSRAGFLVCELLGQQQTVIKPLGEGLPEQRGITGGAIMPDGRVGLILDTAGLTRVANERATRLA